MVWHAGERPPRSATGKLGDCFEVLARMKFSNMTENICKVKR